jgi:hypothetical protein
VKPESEKPQPKPKPPQSSAQQEHGSVVRPAEPPIEAANPAAARKPRRELPKGLGKPLNIHIVNEIVASLREWSAQGYFEISLALSIGDYIVRRYLHDLEVLGVVEQVNRRPMRWSLTADWPAALKKALAIAVTDNSEPKRLARAGRSAPE